MSCHLYLRHNGSKRREQTVCLQDDDSVTNRVAGFICKYILGVHDSCVTSLAVIGREHGYDTTYAVSGASEHQSV